MVDLGATRRRDNEEGGELTVQKCKRPKVTKDEREQELLPGILDEITIQRIAPKLPWTTFHILSLVSHGWQQAIQSRQVYDARVSSQSTQPLVALQHWNSDDDTYSNYPIDATKSNFVLYSVDDGSCYHLPPLPSLKKSIPEHGQCVAMDGKLYVIGGRNDIYVLDLAAQTNWKRCANMIHPREEFGCGIMEGKFYVFGGRDPWSWRLVGGSEIYDPKEDAWFPATPIPSSGFHYKVTTVGEDLLVHSGWCYASEIYKAWLQYKPPAELDHDIELNHHIDSLEQAEIYHPLRDEWKVVKNFTPNPIYTGITVTVGGQLLHMTRFGTKVYDFDNSSWKTGQSYLLGESTFGPREPVAFELEFVSAVVVDDVILAVVDFWENKPGHEDEVGDEVGPHDLRLIRSQRLCTKDKEIVWQDLNFPLSLHSNDWQSQDPFMCLIQV